MAPKIELTYFDARGVAEPIRLALHYAGVDFEDNRVPVPTAGNDDEWKALKPSRLMLSYCLYLESNLRANFVDISETPFGQVPYIEVDGKVAAQSTAILRYVGRKYGLLFHKVRPSS